MTQSNLELAAMHIATGEGTVREKLRDGARAVRATCDTEPAPATPLASLIGSALRDAATRQKGGADAPPTTPEWSGVDASSHAVGPSLLPSSLTVLGIECHRRVRSIRGLGPAWQGECGSTIVQVTLQPALESRRWLITVLHNRAPVVTVRAATFDTARDEVHGRFGLAVPS